LEDESVDEVFEDNVEAAENEGEACSTVEFSAELRRDEEDDGFNEFEELRRLFDNDEEEGDVVDDIIGDV
jgi:hypothetical protein